MRCKSFVILMLLCLFPSEMMAQATVSGFSEAPDFIAGDDQRRDYNNQLCALVKIQVLDEITDLEGNVMGDIVNRGVEKWVYMAEGSRNMKIHLKNSLPLTIKFKEYGINSLIGNRVYVLTIKGEKAEEQLVDFTLRYSPKNAMVLIDAKTYQGIDGVINAQFLPGQYTYIVTADGYEPSEGSVTLKAGKASRLQIELVKNEEELVSVAPVVATTATHQSQGKLPEDVKVGINGNLLTLKVTPFYAKVKIDGVPYEADGDGELTIPLAYGTHTINVEAEGFTSSETSINIKKGVTKKIKLDKLEESKSKKGVLRKNDDDLEIGKTGNLFVLSIKAMEGLKITVDENVWISDSQEKIKTIEYILPYGTHDVKAECEGYESMFFSVNIGKSKVSRSVKLKKLGKKGKSKDQSSETDSKDIIVGQNGNQVEIRVKPTTASIVIDGNRYSPNPKGKLTEKLPYGIHKVFIEAEGYVSQQITIDVGKKGVDKSVKLKKVPRKK